MKVLYNLKCFLCPQQVSSEVNLSNYEIILYIHIGNIIGFYCIVFLVSKNSAVISFFQKFLKNFQIGLYIFFNIKSISLWLSVYLFGEYLSVSANKYQCFNVFLRKLSVFTLSVCQKTISFSLSVLTNFDF